MTIDELRQAAIDYLGQALKEGSHTPVHVVQAAISILSINTQPNRLPTVKPGSTM
jgi:hypothetical protein